MPARKKRLTPVTSALALKDDPSAYYLRGRERRIRRANWEWPEAERHPAVGITRRPYEEAWLAQVGSPGYSEYYQYQYFWDSRYGKDSDASLAAAIEWREEMVKKLKIKSVGWKLSADKAGGVIIVQGKDGYKRALASLKHDGVRLSQAFGFIRYGEAQAIAFAEAALELWRSELAAIAAMPRHAQERIAARGGFVTRKGFPKHAELPLEEAARRAREQREAEANKSLKSARTAPIKKAARKAA